MLRNRLAASGRLIEFARVWNMTLSLLARSVEGRPPEVFVDKVPFARAAASLIPFSFPSAQALVRTAP